VTHFWLLTAVSASYLGTILVYRRLRAVWGRAHGFPPELLRQLDVSALLAPLQKEAPRLEPVVSQLEAGNLAAAQASWTALAGDFPAPSKNLIEGVLALLQAEQEPGRLARYRWAARARRLASQALAGGSGPAPTYLWLQATLGYLTDSVNLELVLWQSGRLLRRVLAQHGQAPLLHLSAALQASVAGETAECLQALARALYHSQNDPFVASLILGLPRIGELAPGLAAEAWKLEEGPLSGTTSGTASGTAADP
jgi:hypothetical protein